MGIFFTEGEIKSRPGVFQRYSKTGFDTVTGGRDGICAIPVQANWGPLGKVVKNTRVDELTKNYGAGNYGTGYTVPAAAAMFDGGASVVYTYRLGTGGKKASKSLSEYLTVTAKYPGTMPISVAIRASIGDATKKQLLVYSGTDLVEEFTFAADGENEGENLIAAAKSSQYIELTGYADVVEALAVASGALEGGENPAVTNANYSTAFAALEPFYYNAIALDVDDDENMTLSLLLQSYKENAFQLGKTGFAVVGEKTTVDFETRCAHARAFNDAKVAYLGGGYIAGGESKDGVLAICYTAGVIASTPTNQGITHSVVNGATDLCETLTYSQYEQAIASGMLLLSMSHDGSVWYDSGVDTLITPASNQDDGWKKIRRTKVRFELFDRLERALAPKVGRVSADTDGVADVVQGGQRVLDAMSAEGKLMPGAVFCADPANPMSGDSAWFLIQIDDIDSLEKIYLHYQFRYSQNS